MEISDLRFRVSKEVWNSQDKEEKEQILRLPVGIEHPTIV